MTVSNEVYRHDHAGNGETVLFAIEFYFLIDAHIKAILYNSVTEVETPLELTTHYTLTGAGNPAGGELTMNTAPTSDEILTILYGIDLKQETHYVEGASFPAKDHETALDKLTMLIKQLQEQIDRCIKTAESQLGEVMISAFVRTLLDDVDSEAFLKTLGFLNPYKSTMTGNETFIFPGTTEKKYFLDPNGAVRNFDPSGSFTAGFQATVINAGSSHNIIFNSGASAQTLIPGNMGLFIYDGSKWW